MLVEYRTASLSQQRGKSSAAAYNQTSGFLVGGNVMIANALISEALEKRNMGRVITEITVENLKDLWDAREGRIADSAVRTALIPNALVDTGATFLSLPTSLIRQLGLKKSSSRRIMTSKVPAESDVYDTVRLTIQGRSCNQDVMEVPDSVPVLVGQLPLEALDFVVDPVQQKVIGNPEHGGEQMYDLL